jgi:hypothetical protein
MLNLRRFVVVVSVVSAVSGILASSALSAVVTQNPVADAFVMSSDPSHDFGGAGALSVAASGLAKGEFQTVMRFDSSAVKAASNAEYGFGQWTVQSVTLKLTATSSGSPFNSSAAGQFSVDWMANDLWTEGSGKPTAPGTTGITFDSLPSFESTSDQLLGTLSYGGATSGATTYTLGLGSSFVTDLLGGNQVSLRLYAADATVSYLFYSRSNVTAANWPVLTVTTTVPAPAMLSTLGAMSLGLLGRRRMHK